jgi:uncharacterized DUF497 family protein
MSSGGIRQGAIEHAQARRHLRSAAAVFLDALALTVYDEANSHDEKRWFTLGFDTSGKLLAVARTCEITGLTNVRIRLISARKATRRERSAYENEPR